MAGSRISSGATVVASGRQVSTDLKGESVILNFDEGVYYGLEKVGARVWEMVRSPVPLAEIRDTIVAEFDVDPDRCEADLQNLLTELAEAGLIEVADEVPS